MKKIILTISCFAFSMAVAICQEKSAESVKKEGADKKATTTASKGTQVKKITDKSKKTTKATSAPPAVDANHPASDGGRPLSAAEIEAKQNGQPVPMSEKTKQNIPASQAEMEKNKQVQNSATPHHALSPAEVEKLKKETAKGDKTKGAKKGKEELRTEGTPDRPLTAAEMQNLQKQGKNVPPPPPPPPNQNPTPAPPPSLGTNTDNANDPDAAKFEFTGGNTYNYGEILESATPTPHEFEFINVGKKPLIIHEAHGSCGCTVPTFSREPVMPGQKGVLTVNYSSRGRIGPISKDVTITANTNPSPVVLHISGSVKANPDLTPPPPPPTLPPAGQAPQPGK